MDGLAAPERWVVSEIIDGEAILLDLRGGHYFSVDGVGAAVWRAIGQGAGRSRILAWIEAAYPAAPQARAEVDAFLDDLIAHGLVEATASGGPAAPDMPPPPQPYRAFGLQKYDDMTDLFMLDPIHDVDEVGWPVRKAVEAEAADDAGAP